MPSLEVAELEQFFAAAARQDHGFAWSRSKQETLLSAGDGWVGDLGKDGALVDRTLWALPLGW